MMPRHSTLAVVATAVVLSCSRGGEETLPVMPAPRPPTYSRQAASMLAGQVLIRRTEYGVPHILADNLRAAGFGMGYSQMEDYGNEVVLRLSAGRGDLAMHQGREALDSDFAARRRHSRAVETYHLLAQDVRDVMEGFAAAVNYFISLHPREFTETVVPDYSGHDVAARDVGGWSSASARGFLEKMEVGTEAGAAGGEHPDDGSNAWALGPSRTSSGAAILMRNPHLSWTAGYYEAQVTVPGVVNFYGDFRIGGPFGIVCGFNEDLGWATTNNYPTLDQVYELDVAPEQPDHYLFDGGRVPITRETVTVRFREENRLVSESREFLHTPLGPVIHRTGDRIYVLRATTDGVFSRPEQVLRMMRAASLEEWQEAVKLRTLPSSNLTYADRAGNIYYVWNAMLPALPHRAAPDSAIHATRTSEIWTALVPFEELPQLLNPDGGYVQNANDPPFFTNLNQILDPGRYPANLPQQRLRFRSQHSLRLLHGDGLLSLQDVIALKHSMRMLVADRVKDDLVAAVRESTQDPELLRASDLLAEWDNDVSPGSRGGVLFAIWAERYLAETDSTTRFAERWSPDAAVETPRGLGDREKAVELFAWAVAETVSRWGTWDPAWGDVHRVRMGAVDVPVGGCASGLGCFRVLSYEEDEDGRLRANGGDGWVLAVEFSSPPRAFSILAYGQSNKEDSPHHSDQARMFAAGRMKRVAFTEAEIDAGLIRSYRPGTEREEF